MYMYIVGIVMLNRKIAIFLFIYKSLSNCKFQQFLGPHPLGGRPIVMGRSVWMDVWMSVSRFFGYNLAVG